MRGGYARGQTDSRSGEKAGRTAGTVLAMHATILIDDLDGFIADPQHLGTIAGNIHYAPFGNAIPATRGVFNLFSPSNEPKMTLMVYELPFAYAKERYYRAGHR